MQVFQPKVEVKKRLKKVIISGVSRMPDPNSFYLNISKVLNTCFVNFNRTLIIEFQFDYINTGSSKWLYFVLKRLEEELLVKKGLIEVIWSYEKDDESIEETGEVLKSQLSFPVTLKEV